MRRGPATFLAGAAAGTLGALAYLRRRRETVREPVGDRRAAELRAKLAEARAAAEEEERIEAAYPGRESTVLDDQPPVRPNRDEPPPADEFEAMRRRVHDEARAAAEEMRRTEDGGADEPA